MWGCGAQGCLYVTTALSGPTTQYTLGEDMGIEETNQLLDEIINQIHVDIILPGTMTIDEVVSAVEIGLRTDR